MSNSLEEKSLTNTSDLNEYEENNNNENITVQIELENSGDDQLLYFNVSGRIFTTTIFTLNVFPNALLGSKEKRDRLPRTKNGEIFFNRHPDVFSSVLTFYQTGIFEVPDGVNHNIFVRDITYYELVNEAEESGLKGFIRYVRPLPKRKWQAYMWRLLEYPDSSTLARIVSMFSLTIIIISIVVFCWETLPQYKKAAQFNREKKLTLKALKDIETFCITYFTLELVARFCFAPNKLTFIRRILNIIDFVSVVPYYIDVIFQLEGEVSIYFLRAVRLVRVFRVFKLSRHSSEMKILGIAVKDSVRELGVLLFFILLGVLLFSSAIYYAEIGNDSTSLTSIPGAFWWSIVTMTTVGYGDEVPKSTGKFFKGSFSQMKVLHKNCKRLNFIA